MNTKVTVMFVVRGLAVATILAVGIAAFWLSFVSLRELATHAGIPAGDAWLFPLVIDATTGVAAVLALVTTEAGVRRWFSWVLGVGTAVSILGNTVHAVIGADRLPWWGCAVVAAVAPVALLVDIHGLILVLRAAQPIPVDVAEPGAESVAVRVPVADPVSVVAEPRQLDPIPDPPMVAVSVAVAPPRPIPARPIPMVMPVARPIIPASRP